MPESTVSDADTLRKRKEMESYEEPEAEGLSESSESNNGEDDSEAAADPAWLRFRREITEYEGFYLTYDEALWKRYLLTMAPCHPSSESAVNHIKDITNLAIERFNQTEGESLELKEVVRANWEITGRFLFYITFEATNGKFYETKVSVMKKQLVDFYFLRVAKYHPNLGSSSSESCG